MKPEIQMTNSPQKTILYIDDDSNNRRLVKRVMEPEGYTVLEAPNADEGMTAAEKYKPDLILMDINMPGMNGYELTTKIKADEDLATISIIALTVAVGKGEKEMALMAGCDGLIAKPIDVDLFPGLVKEYLDGRVDNVEEGRQSHFLKEYSRRLVSRLDEKIGQLSLADKEWEDTFNSISDLVMLLDTNFNVLKVNGAMARRLETTPDALLGKKCYEVFYGQEIECLCRKTIASNESVSLERWNHSLGGMFLEKIYPIFDENEKLTRVMCVATDITEKKEMEEQMFQMEKLSEMGEMISCVSHELRGPLTGILGYSEILDGDESLSSDAKKYTKLIVEEAVRATNIINDLLDFSRKYQQEKRELNVNEALRGIITLKGHQLKMDDVILSADFAEPISGVMGDFHKLQQVFFNIINNAHQALRCHKKGGKVTIKTFEEGLHVMIAIHDDGPGINKEDLKKIFDPFFTTKSLGEGTGLGLHLCKKIVENHNGAVEVLSEESKGTTFIVKLPKKFPDAESSQ